MRERYFQADAEARQSGPIHTIGNGDILAYGQGPTWTEVFGAPYSCPRIFSLTAAPGTECVTVRRPGCGIWEHRFGGGRMIDCASVGYGCILRTWDLAEPVRMVLQSPWKTDRAEDLFPGASAALLFSLPADAPVYNDYPLGHHTAMLLTAEGGCTAEPTENGWLLTFCGSGRLTVTDGESFPLCLDRMRTAGAVSSEEILRECEERDRAFLEACAGNRGELREHPAKARVLEAAEDVLLLIRAQQHRDGGVMAGHRYHMAYVRDQYGVSRGLLAMGAVGSARQIMAYYRHVFDRYGRIANAQGMGVEGIFHVHEEDRTEITGYLLLQATELLAADGDRDFFRTLLPLCDWALSVQLDCLHRGMMPFNGDETYIAGGILPRTVLHHGSLEATMLFITGGRRYLAACETVGHCPERYEEALEKLREAEERYETNFRRGDEYAANSLLRLEGLTEPAYRHGVCYFAFGECDTFGWLMRAAEGCYVCPRCAGKAGYKPCREEFFLKSTLLMAPFIGADQPDKTCVQARTGAILETWRRTGRLPSLPDGTRCLGYDCGLLLYAAAEAGLAADDLLEYTLSLQDECGAWCEYYDNGRPEGTLCRPWESGINIAAALHYLKTE